LRARRGAAGSLQREDSNLDRYRFISRLPAISTVHIVIDMLMEVVQWLRDSGLTVGYFDTACETPSRVDVILDVLAGDRRARFAAQEKRRAPYPNELDRLRPARAELSRHGQPLLVIPFVSEVLGSALTEAGWSWADDQGNFDLRAPGLLLRQRRAMTAPAPKRRSLPRGSGSFAIIRALIGLRADEDQEPGATALARQAGVSQPRASQVLRQLADLKLIESAGHGRWRPHREALLDRFLADYPGPQGSQQHFYSLDSPADVAVRASTLQPRVAVSADIGPDLIVPWRRPSVVIVYVEHAIDPADLELVEAQGTHDANVIIRVPEDRSVFTSPAFRAEVAGSGVSLADPTQLIWDLQDLGGHDRLEAAGRMREWLLARP
jgi:hypothetical protein